MTDLRPRPDDGAPLAAPGAAMSMRAHAVTSVLAQVAAFAAVALAVLASLDGSETPVLVRLAAVVGPAALGLLAVRFVVRRFVPARCANPRCGAARAYSRGPGLPGYECAQCRCRFGTGFPDTTGGLGPG